MYGPSTQSPTFYLGLFLAIGLIGGSFIIGRSLKDIKLANQTITVKGSTEKKITSDLAIWRGSFSQTNPNLKIAYEILKGDQAKVLAYLQSYNISKEQVGISSVQADTLYKMTAEGGSTNDVEGYRVTQTIAIQSNDIALIDKLSREATELIEQNVEFRSNSPEYYYSKINDLKIEMLGEAARDAKERAERLAQSTGNKAGVLKSAQQGVFQITPENSTTVSDYGEYDTSSVRKSVKAVVTMQFGIQ